MRDCRIILQMTMNETIMTRSDEPQNQTTEKADNDHENDLPPQQQQQQHDIETDTTATSNPSSSSWTRNLERKCPLPFLLLPQWAPITTRLLRDNNNGHAWNVLDGVVAPVANTNLPCQKQHQLQQQQQLQYDNNNNNDDDDYDGTTRTCFIQRLEQELDPYFHPNEQQQQQQLAIGKTTSDVKFQKLLQLIIVRNSNPHDDDDDIGRMMMMKKKANNEESSSLLSTSLSQQRGDRCCFLSRKLRSTKEFQTKHPCLTNLIQTIQDTAVYHLQDAMEFNLNWTSVQLSEYPGDGQSGYPRHCDRGPSCRKEEIFENRSSMGRLLTAVYYLTPDDWEADEDGGCLRLFQSNNNNNNKNQDDGDDDAYWDVAPYRGRLVIFRSDIVEHQVLPSKRRPRRAITVWMYGKPKLLSSLSSSSPSKNENVDETRELSLRPTDGASSGAITTCHSSENHISSEHHIGVPVPTTGPPPLPLPSNEVLDSNQQAKIFVSIASYRDSETGPTLQNLMQTARFPERVFVGLVLQVDTEDEYDQHEVLDRLPTHEAWYHSRVRVLTLHAKNATGPCPARAMCQTLLYDEDYILQIDAHMRFRPNWDVYLIQQLAICSASSSSSSSSDQNKHENNNNNKYMLTTYPVGYELPNKIPNETRGTLLVPWKFDQDGMLRQKSQFFSETPQAAPVRCYLYAAGFNFAPAAVARDCPYDSSLHHLFFGEEISMAVRLYAAGYALYAPCQSVCYHLWSRAHRPAWWRSSRRHQALSVPETGTSSIVVDTTLLMRRKSQQKVREQLVDVGRLKANEFAMHLGVDFGQRSVRVNANPLHDTLWELDAAAASTCSESSSSKQHEQCSRWVKNSGGGDEKSGLVLFHELLMRDRGGTNAKRILEYLG